MADDFDQYKVKPQGGDEWDQYKATPQAAPQPAAPEPASIRAAKGVGRGLMNMGSSLVSTPIQVGAEGGKFIQEHPILGAIPGVSQAVGAYKTLYANPRDAAESEMQQAAQQHGTQVPMAGHVMANIPVLGPMGLSMGRRAAEGDVAGALGEAGAYAVAPELARNATPQNISAPVRGAVKTINAAKRNAPAVLGTAGTIGGLGEALSRGDMAGLWYKPLIGGIAGERLGKFLQKAPDIPGEELGLQKTFAGGRFEPAGSPQRGTAPLGPPAGVGQYQPPERVVPQQTQVRTPAPRPEPPEPITAPIRGDVSKLGPPAGVGPKQPPESTPITSADKQAFLDSVAAKRQKMGLMKTAPVVAEPVSKPSAPPSVSMADQIATAKNLGFKNLHDAISRFGFEGWQKILGQGTQPAVPEPPSVRPGSPTPFRANEPEQIPSLSRNQRADLMEDKAIKQEMMGEEGPRSMVTGRKGGSVSLFPNESQSLLGHERQASLERGREIAAGNQIGETKGSLLQQFRGVAAPKSTAEVQAARPLPGSDVAANRTVGQGIRPLDEEIDYISGKRKPTPEQRLSKQQEDAIRQLQSLINDYQNKQK